MQQTQTQSTPLFLYLAWIFALTGALGSLFFSEVVGYPPCTLCWYQRICLYPLVILLPVGLLLQDRNLKYYAAPFSVIGAVIAGYHNLLYYGIITEGFKTCTGTVSCSSKQLELLGFITIPLLSLGAFIVITALILLGIKNNKSLR